MVRVICFMAASGWLLSSCAAASDTQAEPMDSRDELNVVRPTEQPDTTEPTDQPRTEEAVDRLEANESVDQPSTAEQTDQPSSLAPAEDPLRVEIGVAPGRPKIPVTTINFDVVDVWCDEAEGLAYLAIGDLWETKTNAGVFVQVDPDAITLNKPLNFPLPEDVAVVFLADPNAPEGVSSEYASGTINSQGTVQFEALPCNGNGNSFAFAVSGAIGDEGLGDYDSTASIEGTFRSELTSAPAWLEEFPL